MFINNSESGLDKIFQSCRITLQHSGFVNLLPRIYGHVIQGGDGGRGGQWRKSARPQNLEPSHAVKIVRQLLTFVKKFGLEHPELKQFGEQEEPLFMGRIVKENLPLSTHRRPYVRFSEEARGPSGQSQLQPA